MNQKENEPTLRKRGRPVVEDKGIRVTIRLKKHEESLLKAFCSENNLTLTDAIRALILFKCEVNVHSQHKK